MFNLLTVSNSEYNLNFQLIRSENASYICVKNCFIYLLLQLYYLTISILTKLSRYLWHEFTARNVQHLSIAVYDIISFVIS